MVVTPTKGLANNLVSELQKMGISAFAYSHDNLVEARRNGKDLASVIKECSTYQVIFVDPEHLSGKEWRIIAEWPNFRSSILFFAVDEVDLIKEWGIDFRPCFKLIGLPFRDSCTGKDTTNICKSLGFFGSSFHLVRRSNERPNTPFIFQILTHGLAGLEFPDLLPFLQSGRKLSIHVPTIDMVFRVYVYIWRLQSSGADKLRRTRMYHIASVRQIFPLVSRPLSIFFAREGSCGAGEGSLARGIVLVQPSSIAAAVKQLQGSAPPAAEKSTTEKKKNGKKARKAAPPMPHEKALVLTETLCIIAAINRHYANPSLEITTLDCIAARRPLPCSLCSARAKRKITFPIPEYAARLPPLVATATAIRVTEQLSGHFRNVPRSLFLGTSLQTALLDKLLSLKSGKTHQHTLQVHPRGLRQTINSDREIARIAQNAKAQATRNAKKRKRAADSSCDEAGPQSGRSQRARRPRKRVVARRESSDDEENNSDSSLPENLLPVKTPRTRTRPALKAVTNTARAPKPRDKLPRAAETAAAYGPRYKTRTR
ncbi:hypothetical protein C8R47DRAFT_1197718 [Mycena vitilis]|nr:hypothetical protein C8R47DRAFT_1197718 [Mycena vitilis]